VDFQAIGPSRLDSNSKSSKTHKFPAAVGILLNCMLFFVGIQALLAQMLVNPQQ
jgi:hypothetical protein